MVTPYRVRCSVIDNEVYIAPVSVWALGPRFARLVAQRLLLWARPLFSIQRFQGGLRLWLRRPEKVGLKASRTRSVC